MLTGIFQGLLVTAMENCDIYNWTPKLSLNIIVIGWIKLKIRVSVNISVYR